MKLKEQKDLLLITEQEFDKSINTFSSNCKSLIDKEINVSKTQVNTSIDVGKFVDDENFDEVIRFFSKKCQDMILNKTKPVSTDLY